MGKKSGPCQPSAADLQGVRAAHGPLQSAEQIHWRDEEGHSGLFAPMSWTVFQSICVEEIY
jgi:hypothetical protein